MWTSHSGSDRTNIPRASDRGSGINKNTGMEMHFQGNGGKKRGEARERTPPWRALVRRAACQPSVARHNNTEAIPSSDSNCLARHYILLNTGPISLLTRLAVTTELHWHSQSLSPVGPGPLNMCVCVCVCGKDTAWTCQFETYQLWGLQRSESSLLQLFSRDSQEAVEHLWT